MNKIVVIILSVFCVFLVLALILVGFVFLLRSAPIDTNNQGIGSWWQNLRNNMPWLDFGSRQSFKIDESRKLDLQAIDQIEIKVVSEDLRLSTAPGELTAHLSGTYRSSRNLDFIVRQEGTKAVVTINYPMMGLTSSQMKLAVTIPADFAGSVTVDVVSANGELPDDLDYGWSQFTFNAVSGDLTVEAATMANLNTKSVSGKIKASKIACPVKADSISGKISLSYRQFTNTKIKTMSGDIEVKLPADASCQLAFSSVSGDFKNDGLTWSLLSQQNHKTSARLGAGQQTLDVETVSGNLSTAAK
jgi:hypothetical protein